MTHFFAHPTLHMPPSVTQLFCVLRMCGALLLRIAPSPVNLFTVVLCHVLWRYRHYSFSGEGWRSPAVRRPRRLHLSLKYQEPDCGGVKPQQRQSYIWRWHRPIHQIIGYRCRRPMLACTHVRASAVCWHTWPCDSGRLPSAVPSRL